MRTRTAHRTMVTAAILCLVVACAWHPYTVYADDAELDSLMALFDYDRDAPLELETVSSQMIGGFDAALQDINYVSPGGGRVTAYLVLPTKAAQGSAEANSDLDTTGQVPAGGTEPGPGSGGKPYAGIVFLHWGQGDRSEFIWEAALYAEADAISVLVDAPWNRPPPWTGSGERLDRPELTRDMYVQNVVDLRRAVDLLVMRGDVDENRIAYVGHSFGATWGGVLAAVEKRIKTCVLMGGLPSLTDFSLGGAPKFDNYIRILEEQVPNEMLEAYLATIAPLAPGRFVGRAAPCSVFMQFGTYDSWISRRAAESYYDAASEPKRIEWYPTSHEFTDVRSLLDRAQWFEERIGLKTVSVVPGHRGEQE